MLFFNKDHRTIYICPKFIKNGPRHLHFNSKDKYESLVIIVSIEGGQFSYNLLENKVSIKANLITTTSSPIVIPLTANSSYHLVIHHVNHVGKVKIYLKKKQ